MENYNQENQEQYAAEQEHVEKFKCNIKENAEKLKHRACEMEGQISKNIDEFMNVTAENLDIAASKMHDTAEFFRAKNTRKFKDDVSQVVRKNPTKSVAAAVLLGFLFGKLFFR